jgi:hypothetical protein
MSPARNNPVQPFALAPADLERLEKLAVNNPELCRIIITETRRDQRHRRWLPWSDLIVQTIGHLCGLGALVVLAAVAWHAIDRGDATQGAAIITSGAVGIVAVFVTGRLTSVKKETGSRRTTRREQLSAAQPGVPRP